MVKAENYREFIVRSLQEIMAVDSPTGFSAAISEKLLSMLSEMGYKGETTNKRLVKVSVPGAKKGLKRAVSAHTDTLGAMVRSVAADGRIRFTRLGGPILPTFDGEYCRIYADGGKVYTGTFLSDSCSCHVYKDAGTLERNENTMFVRLDEEVYSAADVAALGIRTGSPIALDPKTTVTESGFVKSRFLDDKAGSVCLLTALEAMRRESLVPEYDTDFCFTNYEEVGSGAGDGRGDADELLAVDMAVWAPSRLQGNAGVRLRQGQPRALRLRDGGTPDFSRESGKNRLCRRCLSLLRFGRGGGMGRRSGRQGRPDRSRACTLPTAWNGRI